MQQKSIISRQTSPDFIIFGEGNYNTLGVLHQLGVANIDPFILSVGKSKDRKKGHLIGYSKYAKRIYEVTSNEEGLNWILNNKISFAPGTVIYPTSDKAEQLLDLNFSKLIGHFRFPNAGKEGAVSRLMDKKIQTELAESEGIRIINSQYSSSQSFSLKKVEYPCMVKPLNSTKGSKGDMKVCYSEKELTIAINEGKNTKEYIIQKYIKNEADLLFLGVSFDNEEIWLPSVVIKPGVLPTGEYTHAIVSTDVKKYLPEIEHVKNFVKKTGYKGPFSIEFGLEKGKNHFFEINLRNDGTSQYPLKAGVNLAKAYFENKQTHNISLMEYEMIDEIGDFRRVFNREISLSKWLKSFHKAGSYRHYYQGDYSLIPYLFAAFIARVSDKLVRMIKKP